MSGIKNWPWGKIGLFVGGMLTSTYGFKILGSRDMKKAYTHCTAAVIRMKDEVQKDFTNLRENCGDIKAGADDINEKRREEYDRQLVEDAKAVLAEKGEAADAEKA